MIIWVSLGIAVLSLAVATAKVLYDVFVSQKVQLRHQRTLRHEQRVEQAATEVRGLIGGLDTETLMSCIEQAWMDGDAERLGEGAALLASAAELAYQAAETAGDPMEIIVGVLWIEAMQLQSSQEALAGIPPEQWATHPAAEHWELMHTYRERLEQRLIEVLEKP